MVTSHISNAQIDEEDAISNFPEHVVTMREYHRCRFKLGTNKNRNIKFKINMNIMVFSSEKLKWLQVEFCNPLSDYSILIEFMKIQCHKHYFHTARQPQNIIQDTIV